MKKTISILLLTLMALGASAQLFKVGKFDVGFVYVGPKIGMNFTKINRWSYDYVDTKSKFGYQFGAVGEFGFTNKFSIQTELLFLSRGTKTTEFGIETTRKTNSIAIPILAKYAFRAFGLSKVYATGGTYTTLKTSGVEIFENGQTWDDYHWKTFDWGLSFGVGGEYDAKQGIWALDVRYDLGLVDVYKQMDENTRSQFRNLNITVTYKYDLVDLVKRIRAKRTDPDKK